MQVPSSTAYGSATYNPGAYPGTALTLPTWVLETSYLPSTLTVYDYHGKTATCAATVAIWVRSPRFLAYGLAEP